MPGDSLRFPWRAPLHHAPYREVMTTNDEHSTVLDIINDARIVVLTYQDSQGHLVSSPMGNQKTDTLEVVRLLTGTDTDKATEIGANPEVNVHYGTDTGWVSLSGNATVQTDPATLKELWNAGAEAWLPEGPDSPSSGYFEISVHSAKYWDAPGRPAQAIQFIKGLVSDEQPDMGSQGVVEP